MIIRKARYQDVFEISNLIQESIKRINSKDLTKKQIWAWTRHYSEFFIRKLMKKESFFCLIQENKILAVAFLKKGFLHGIYVTHNKVRQGYGTKLIKFIEKYAKKSKIPKIYLDACVTAIPFYNAHNYVFIKKVDQKVFGVKFQEFKMEKKL